MENTPVITMHGAGPFRMPDILFERLRGININYQLGRTEGGIYFFNLARSHLYPYMAILIPSKEKILVRISGISLDTVEEIGQSLCPGLRMGGLGLQEEHNSQYGEVFRSALMHWGNFSQPLGNGDNTEKELVRVVEEELKSQ